MPFHKIARTDHRNHFEYLAILLHLNLSWFVVKMLSRIYTTPQHSCFLLYKHRTVGVNIAWRCFHELLYFLATSRFFSSELCRFPNLSIPCEQNIIRTLSAKAKKTGSSKLRSKFETLRREIKADVRKQHDLYLNNLVGDVKAVHQ